MKTTTKKTITKKKVTAYSPKEIADITKDMLVVLNAPTDATPEEMSGAVVVILKDKKKGGYNVQGGIRNISTGLMMTLMLEILKLSPMDGAILMAQLASIHKKAGKPVMKSVKKGKK